MTPAEQLIQSLRQQIGSVIFGCDEVIHGLCVALVSQGHVLLEGVPGVGKTLLAKSMASLLGGSFKRVQCTADLMPSDLTGVHIFNNQEAKFEFVPGPLFADIVLVDEINRTGPKTQSALLQAMEEGFITIDRSDYELPENFLVIASENPHEFEGTYPLPESQLDRFLLRLIIDYPNEADEEKVLRKYDSTGGHARPKLEASEPLGQLILEAREQARQIHISDPLYKYVTNITKASREHHLISLGLSTRGALGLMRCARVSAALEGASFATPDHIKKVAHQVMAHRLILTAEATLEDVNPSELVNSILAQAEVPREQSSELEQ